MKRSLLYLAVVAVTGCGTSQLATSGTGAGKAIYIAVDNSESARKQISAFGNSVRDVVLDAKQGDSVTLFRYGLHCQEIRSKTIDDEEVFGSFWRGNFKEASPERGTAPSRALQAVEAAIRRQQPSGDIEVLIYTDGDNDDQSSEAEKIYREAAAALARESALKKVVFIGVKSGNREEIYRHLSPLGSKVKIMDDQDYDVRL